MTQIRIVGALGITEAVCIAISPIVFAKMWPKIKAVGGQRIILFMFLWFFSAVCTDIYRESSWRDALRGIFVLPFLFSAFVVTFSLLWDDLVRLRWIALGIVLSAFVSMYAFPAQSLAAWAQKYGQSVQEAINFKTFYAKLLILAISWFSIVLYKRRPVFVVLIQLAVSGVCLFLGNRSGFLILFLSAAGIWIAANRVRVLQAIQRNIFVLATVTAVLVFAGLELYSAAASAGMLGKSELQKFERQTDSSIGLLESRSHFIAAMFAIADSPILGHGSWAMDRNYYGAKMYEFLGDSTEQRRYSRQNWQKGLWIPTHSHLWQAWVWHGVLGAVFWISILLLMLRYVRDAIHLCRPLIGYNILVFLFTFWHLFFSPFSDRIRWGMIICVALLSVAEKDRRRKLKAVDSSVDVDAPWDGKWRI